MRKYFFQYYKFHLLVLLLSLVLVGWYFTSPVMNMGSVFFSPTGDGLQNYYSMMYHVEHDQNYFLQEHMNYPYGENIVFTGGQPLLGNILKLFFDGEHVVQHVLFSYNFVMFLSIVLAPLFLFLIFTQMFRVGKWHALLFALGITFLSPQLARLPGHFALSFIFAIPCFIFLLYRFSLQPTFLKSIAIALFTLVVASFHLYYLGFFAVIALVFFALKLIHKRDFSLRNMTLAGTHLLVQVFIPYFLLSLVTQAQVDVNDRTELPWGYFEYTSNWSGVLLQSETMPKFIKKNIHWDNAPWEGVAYIGLFAIMIGLGTIFYLLKRKFLLNKNLLINNDRFWLLVLVLSGFLGLLYSFAIPLKWNDWLFHHSGPLKQMRGVGRFAWIFYYCINIAAVIIFVRWLEQRKSVMKKSIFVGLAVGLLCFEAHMFVKKFESRINNYFPEMSDTENKLPENRWIRDFDFTRYQAIIPLPFFHIGSENYVINIDDDQIKKHTYLLSLKSGLPTVAMSGSRTSRGQALNIAKLFMTPYERPSYIDDLPSSKPFLVLVDTERPLKEQEIAVLDVSKEVFEYGRFKLLSLSPDKLDRRASYASQIKETIEASDISLGKSWQAHNNKHFYFENFDHLDNRLGLEGTPAITGKINNYTRLYEGELKGMNVGTLTCSYWFKGIDLDLYPRSSIELVIETDKDMHYQYFSVFRTCKQVVGDWGLIEFEFDTAIENEQFKKMYLSVYNHDIYGDDKMLVVDNLMIRLKNSDLYRVRSGVLSMNNLLIPSPTPILSDSN